MARLFVLSGTAIGDSFEIDGTSVIGRSPEADVTVAEASISRRHARLVPQLEPGLWGLVDLDSSNGVFIAGKRVRKARVRDGETFKLGDVEFRLRDEGEVEEEAASEEFEFEDDLDELTPAPVEPEPVEPAPVEPRAEKGPEEDPEGDFELELEFGDDLEAALEAPASPPPAPESRSPKAPGAQGRRPSSGPRPADRVGARATADRAARRQAAMGGTARPAASSGAARDGGRPVLQYSKTRSGGTDIAQVSGAVKVLVVLGALLALAGAAYGAFLLTS